MSEACCVAMQESENAIDAMVRIMGLFDGINRQMNPLTMLELERYYPEAFKQFKDKLLERDIQDILSNIKQGMEEGLYRADIDPEFMARYRMELSLLMFQPTLLINDSYNLPHVGRQITEHFLYGIMTNKGEKLYQKYKEQYIKQVSKL